MKICLIGLTGSGKTTVGLKLAKLLNSGFADTDQIISERSCSSIASIFETRGENYFRTLEADVLEQLLTYNKPLVISTGGGCVETPRCRNLIFSQRTIWVKTDVEVIRRRLNCQSRKISTDSRPLLPELELLDRRRRRIYNLADQIFDNNSELNPRRLQKLIGKIN